MRRTILVLILSFTWAAGSLALAQDSTLDVDKKRQDDLSQFGTSDLPSAEAIRASAQTLFSKSLKDQSDKELETLAREANHYANLIGYIQSEYDSYYRKNFRYDFIQEKVAEPHDAYVKVANEFKAIRNEAYYNLGKKALAADNRLGAFFYFRDAFRLAAFDCGKGRAKEQCVRWRAEQEMQKLLGINDIRAYVSWQ